MPKDELKHEYKKGELEIKFPEPFQQKDLENFQMSFQKRLSGFDDLPGGKPPQSVVNSAIARTLIELKWLTGIQMADVAGYNPGYISWVGMVASAFIVRAQEIPKN